MKQTRLAGPALTLEWRGLGCWYASPSGPRAVLRGVSGAARPYELQAVLGPSGAGKSTLLDILAGRKSVGRLAGEVRVNGLPAAGFQRHAAYVPQEDAFLATMTVAETCRLHAALTLPRGTPRAHAARRTDEVLAAMGMLHAADTLVGGVLPGGLTLRGLSGGERKRLSIAAGVLAAPSILFLDEPTSGLDACSALSVLSHLRDRARDSGLTVVASIHQPRAAVWAAFDAVTLLSEGLLVYAGPCAGVVAWFESLGLGPWRADAHGTACDWAMDLVNLGFEARAGGGGGDGDGGGRAIASREELEAAAAKFAAHYERSRLEAGGGGGGKQAGGGVGGEDEEEEEDGQKWEDTETGGADGAPRARRGSLGGRSNSGAGAVREGAAAATETASAAAPSPPAADRRRQQSWAAQFRALLWREMAGAARNPADVAGRMLLFAYLGAAAGLVFWRCGDGGGLEAVRDRMNVVFMLVLSYLLMPFVYISLYAADKRHFVADSAARLYRPSAYYAAKSVAVLPFIVANVAVSCSGGRGGRRRLVEGSGL